MTLDPRDLKAANALASLLRQSDGPERVLAAIRDHIEPVHLIPGPAPTWEDS